jgi:two-component system, OmpR family, sensor kinase
LTTPARPEGPATSSSSPDRVPGSAVPSLASLTRGTTRSVDRATSTPLPIRAAAARDRGRVMRLKDQLSLTFAGVTLAAMLAAFVAVSLLVHRDELRELDSGLLYQAHSAAELARERERVGPIVDGFANVPEVLVPIQRFVAVYDADGHVLAQSKAFTGNAPSLRTLGVGPIAAIDDLGFPVDLSHEKTRLRGVVVPIGTRGRSLLFAAPRTAFDADMTYLYRVFSAILVATAGIIAFVARALGQKLVRDVEVIADVARSVAEGDLDARIRDRAHSSLETAQLAAGLDHMIAELSTLVATQQTFISHAAHELRSPLATLRGELQLALRRPRNAEEYRETIREVLEEVEMLASLAEDLLALARMQRSVQTEATTSLAGAIADAVHMARGPAKTRSVTILEPDAAHGLDESLWIKGPRQDIARAIRNLVDNAVAHSPRDGTVVLALTVFEPFVELVVTDEGPGVPPEDAPNIFAPFFRGAHEQSDEGGSSGLGLAIAREIARGAGGDIVLDHGHHGGARFVLTLGRAAPAMASSRAVRADDDGAESAPNRTGNTQIAQDSRPEI